MHSATRCFLSALALACAAVTALPAHATDVTGNATLTSDYVWRGTSQTMGDPAVQAGVKFAADNGLYASVWGSNVEFAPELHASSEFDFTVGYGRKVSDDWAFDVNVLHYRYPSTTSDLNWTELNGTATYRDNTWLSIGWSPEALGTDGNGTYALLGGRLPINDRFRLEGALAHYFLDDALGESYSHANVSAIWTIKAPFELRITAHATDGEAKDLFGDEVAGNRIEAALQASF
jgi:uncharacterized protein (TIGR02001 family)